MPTETPPDILRARQQLGRRIRALRRERGYSQEVLAHRSGLDRHTVYRTELATHSASVDVVLMLAAALGVPVVRLFEDG